MNSITLEDARCPLCARVPTKVVRKSPSWLDGIEGTFEVRACPGCGMWISSPRPVADDLSRVYPPGYHKVRLVEADEAPRAAPHRGKLLDVGCGVGDGMALARAEGWECYGIEIDRVAATVARRRGFSVTVGDATKVDFPAGPFAQVRCWHTLEHMVDPVTLLARIRAALSETGYAQVVVPNRASVTATVFRRFWYPLDLPRHLHHFRPDDVSALSARTGLRVTRARHMASPSGLLGSLDCVVAGLGRPRSRGLRSNDGLRRWARAITWWFAKVGGADAVEYTLVRDAGYQRTTPDR